jgi:alcohol dehydrogenase class IV
MSLISYLTRVHFADRVLEDALPEELRRLRVTRPMVVRDVAGRLPERADRLDDALPPECRAIAGPDALWPPTPAGPGLSAAAALHAAGRCDAVIGFGGAAALDFARLLGRRLATAGDIPVIAIPTTTGNVGLGPLAWPLAGGDGPGLRPVPTVVLCDPTLAHGGASADIALAGIDTLTHCVEAFLGTAFNPPADGIALEGARRAVAHLERAVADPHDPVACREMMAAALCAGMAAEKGLGGVEALARAIEAEAGAEARHGQFHAALLPPVLAFNAPAIDDRVETLAAALRVRRLTAIADTLADLGARVGLARRLGGAGLDEDALRRAAAAAAEERANRTNPRHATPQDYLELLRAAL